MRIEDAIVGARILERHKHAMPRTIVAWEEYPGGMPCIIVKGASGRKTKIKAANLGRYDLLSKPPETSVVCTYTITQHGKTTEPIAVNASPKEANEALHKAGL